MLRQARVVRQPGAGSCLFHSLAHGLRDARVADYDHRRLRQALMDWLARHEDLKIADTPVRDWVLWDANQAVPAYVGRMRIGGWGGGIEMAACARKFRVDLAKGSGVQRSGRFLNRYLFGAPMVAMAFGVVMTVLVQRSSITTSLIIPLIGAGILTLEQVFPFTLGANIGTTVTAMLASLATGNPAAVTVAFAHLVFNLTGIGIVYPLAPIRRIPLRLARGLAELTSRSRAYAFVYVGFVFFALHVTLIYFWR